MNVVDLQTNQPQVSVCFGEKTPGSWCHSAWIRPSSVGGGAPPNAPPPVIVAKGLAGSLMDRVICWKENSGALS